MSTGSMDIRALENESLLQLYADGELSTVDRLEVEEHLRVDSSLRVQLQEVQSLQSEVECIMAKLDRLDPIVPSAASERIVMRVIRRQMTEIAARPKPSVKLHRMSKLAWTGIGAAAAIVVFCLSILNTSVRDRLSPRVFSNTRTRVATQDRPSSSVPQEDAVRPWAVAMIPVDQSSQKLEKLEWLVHDDLQDAWH